MDWTQVAMVVGPVLVSSAALVATNRFNARHATASRYTDANLTRQTRLEEAIVDRARSRAQDLEARITELVVAHTDLLVLAWEHRTASRADPGTKRTRALYRDLAVAHMRAVQTQQILRIHTRSEDVLAQVERIADLERVLYLMGANQDKALDDEVAKAREVSKVTGDGDEVAATMRTALKATGDVIRQEIEDDWVEALSLLKTPIAEPRPVLPEPSGRPLSDYVSGKAAPHP